MLLARVGLFIFIFRERQMPRHARCPLCSLSGLNVVVDVVVVVVDVVVVVVEKDDFISTPSVLRLAYCSLSPRASMSLSRSHTRPHALKLTRTDIHRFTNSTFLCKANTVIFISLCVSTPSSVLSLALPRISPHFLFRSRCSRSPPLK